MDSDEVTGCGWLVSRKPFVGYRKEPTSQALAERSFIIEAKRGLDDEGLVRKLNFLFSTIARSVADPQGRLPADRPRYDPIVGGGICICTRGSF